MITLSDGATTVQLNPDLFWSDENWLPVVSNFERSLTGALIVSVGTMIGGRPVTLQSFDENSGWVAHSVLSQLRVWASVAAKALTLNLRGETRTVIFDHSKGAIEASPVTHYSDVDPGDFYRVVLRFVETV